MAIPTFGGMTIEVVTMLVVPVLYCGIEEFKLKRAMKVAESAKD
jgi:Cu(I)/Ag(I) efflux system membrane protein CusA/SilA